ncbi:TPA: hypothetical protein DEA21_02215 [Candidatus Uhrbacteria bacterium]|nr:hypothetical protein [Candidatus Uhrbacteria bacterium]HCU31434.1 hypothetical protein [Candidatus Uhrbacteria bacterium]
MKNLISTQIPTEFGNFKLWVQNGERGRETIALSSINLDPKGEILLRIHSECLTGDTFYSLACDCGQQKNTALREISKHGNGIFIYHRQEGRNLGLFKKVQAYNLILDGLDTHEANILLSGKPDGRDYTNCLEILEKILGQKSPIVLLSNNPYKRLFLERAGYKVVMHSLLIEPNLHNKKYFTTKEQKFSHYDAKHSPYIGVTLWLQDVKEQGEIIAKLVNSFEINDQGRKIFLGLALSPKNGDLKNRQLQKHINNFAKKIKNQKNVNLVLHLDYCQQRQFYRELKNFLDSLTFRYSLQIRTNDSATEKINLEILDSLKKENIIFQIRSEQISLLKNPEFTEYFQKTGNYLLLDDSLGRGISESISTTQEKILSIVRKGLSHIAVAGGYDSKKLDKIIALEDFFKIPISVDAESGLRQKGKLNLDKTAEYLKYFFDQNKKPTNRQDKKTKK